MPKLNEDTKEVLSESQDILELSKHPGFEQLRRKLWDKIFEINSLSGIDLVKTTKQELLAMQAAAELLVDFLKEIDGTLDRSKSADEIIGQMIEHRREKDYVVHLE